MTGEPMQLLHRTLAGYVVAAIGLYGVLAYTDRLSVGNRNRS